MSRYFGHCRVYNTRSLESRLGLDWIYTDEYLKLIESDIQKLIALRDAIRYQRNVE